MTTRDRLLVEIQPFKPKFIAPIKHLIALVYKISCFCSKTCVLTVLIEFFMATAKIINQLKFFIRLTLKL
jgi:hypothetical protein